MLKFETDRLKTLRETFGIQVEEAAAKVGKTKQQWTIWENGVNSPSVENLLVICNAFDVDVSFFFDDVSHL